MSEPLTEMLERCLRERIPANVVVARMIGRAESREQLCAALAAVSRGSHGESTQSRERLGEIDRCWHDNESAFELLRSVLREADHRRPATEPLRWRETFDRVARISPDAGAAIYALGRADLLDAATASIVARLVEWDLVSPACRVLDLGCGAGRMIAALAPRVAAITGLDVSGEMLRSAEARTAGSPNVRIVLSDSGDLRAIASASSDLVLAVDVFPYIAACGADTALRMFRDCRRVLAREGHLVILNFAYGRGFDAERRDVGWLAGQSGFEVRRAAQGDFALWDGTSFVLERGE